MSDAITLNEIRKAKLKQQYVSIRVKRTHLEKLNQFCKERDFYVNRFVEMATIEAMERYKDMKNDKSD